AVLVIVPQHAHGPEAHRLEEKLSSQVRFADFQSDPRSPMAGQFADELGDHLPADADAPANWAAGEIQGMELDFVELVNHKANDLFPLLGNHADAVPLAQAAEEVFFGPRVLKAVLFRLQHFRHIAANHPANMDADLLLLCSPCAHSGTSPRHGAR